MNLTQSKIFLTEKGYKFSRRFKNTTESKYWLYEVTAPNGLKKSYKTRDIELLARRVKNGLV